ncbi:MULTISPECIES: fic family toxin-antitoxin system, toxin component [unclassified Streptomyces]|uniref:fic family toxin-antitoxin system, toxin component n=1 Tax=Streptomycetaceae TaxID=2062 RepID=UPI002E78DF33|nr:MULTISPECIES: fic family toxin-antitoxin system, toxin component [unclassified Streptomyces]MED7951054.1 fic family toxin-antitoxin system, toxin component [Streptomyces sp. BE303]MEE1821519.1 fic family toxin-antitoxin system, toxin component [Streptomyces sp. BE20]
MILRVDRAWLLDVTHQFLAADPDVTDYGTLAAAVARHVDEVMEVPVYGAVHQRAAALMHQLIRVPALEYANEHFAAVVAASYLSASGVIVTAEPKAAVALAARVRDGQADVRETATAIRTWYR